MPKNRFATLALTLLSIQLMLPSTGFASGSCTVSVMDTVAGLGTQATITNCTTTSSVTVRITGPTGAVYDQSISVDAVGNAVTLIPSRATLIAGTYHVTIGDSVSSTFSVISDRPDDNQTVLSASPSSVPSSGNNTVRVSMVVRDRYQNPVTGRPIALISNRLTDNITALSDITSDDGVMTWSVTPKDPGVMTLVAYDVLSARQMKVHTDVSVGSAQATVSTLTASLSGLEQGGDTLTADIGSVQVTDFKISLLPEGETMVRANELFSIVVQAERNNSVVRGYIGTLVVESSDPDAELPKKGKDPKSPALGLIDMRNVDQGIRRVPLSFLFKHTGVQTITVWDKLNPSIKGSIDLTVTRGSGQAEDITILDPIDGARIKRTDTLMISGKAPSFTNLNVEGLGTSFPGDSDAENTFRIPIKVPADYNELTLYVESENKTYKSKPIHIFIDDTAPVITTAEIDPSEGKTESKGMITVLTESTLPSVTATIDGVKTTLIEKEGTAGTYTGEITAPKKEGVYDVTISASDQAGNATTLLLKWTIGTRAIPTVQNVKVESSAGQMMLSWSAVDGVPVSAYKIYIAKESDPLNILYSVSTQKPVTSAVIKDLPHGERYIFTMTAITKDGFESAEKSASVVAGSPRITLKATPGDSSAVLQWLAIENLPLSQYILEYGTEAGVYTEKRTVNGQATTMTIRDLIPGITYEFKLTPVTVTGKTETEMASLTRVIAGGNGFAIGSVDPAPSDLTPPLHAGADLKTPSEFYDVPTIPSSGISSIVIVMALIFALTVGLSWIKLERERRATRAFLSSLGRNHLS